LKPIRNSKISFILPNLGGGGAEKVYLNLAEALIEKGFKVQFVLLEEKGELLSFLPRGATIYALNIKRFRNSIYPLVKYFKHENPDIILTSLWPLTSASVFAWILAGRRGKLFLAEHSNLTHTYIKTKKESYFYLKLIINITYRFATGVIGVSKGVMDDLVYLGNLDHSKTKVIYNPVIKFNAPSLNEDPKIPDFWKDCSYKILAIGRFIYQKDHKSLISAFSVLNNSLKAKLVILGDGPLWNETKLLVDSLGLQDSIDLPGFSANPRHWYQQADLFVLSSRFEGLPTVLIEALDYGVTIVSTDCPSGPSEILGNGKYGTLVPVGDIHALANAMHKNLLKPMDKGILKNRALDFSIDKITEQYLNFFYS
jgi:glycosyltransferase involved in cell wall biosynthesis